MKPVVIEYTGNKMLSVNHLYGRLANGRMFLKPAGVTFKRELIYKYGNKPMLRDKELGYELELYGDWYNTTSRAKTKIKKRDSNNLLKLILDGVCEALDIDDSQFFEEYIVKKQADKPGFKMKIKYIKAIDNNI